MKSEKEQDVKSWLFNFGCSEELSEKISPLIVRYCEDKDLIKKDDAFIQCGWFNIEIPNTNNSKDIFERILDKNNSREDGFYKIEATSIGSCATHISYQLKMHPIAIPILFNLVLEFSKEMYQNK